MQRAGNVAFQNDSLGTLGDLGIRDRNRGKQGLRVGVDGAVIELIRVRCLYYSSKVHNSDSVRNMSDYQQVVRDEEISNTELFLQLFKHIDDLRLDGNVQRGYGFVADDEFGIYSQRSRDTDTLSLAAGELVDVSCRVLRVQSDQFHEAEDLLSALCFVGIEFMDVQGLADDLFDRHTGIQRGIGILENHLHLGAVLDHVLICDQISVVVDLAAGGLVETQKRTADSSLAAAGLAYKSESLTGLNAEVHSVNSL